MFLETVEAVENVVAQGCSEVNVLSRHAILSLHHLEPCFGTLPLSSYSLRSKLCRALQTCRLTKIRQGLWNLILCAYLPGEIGRCGLLPSEQLQGLDRGGCQQDAV